MTCTHQPGKTSAVQGSTLPCFHSAKGPAQRRLHLVLARDIYLFLQAPGQRKGNTQSLTVYIFPAQWQCWEGSLQLSVTPHKDAVIFNVRLKSPSGGALRAVKELSRAAKQTPLMKAHTIINRLIYSIQLWKAISKCNERSTQDIPQKNQIFN